MAKILLLDIETSPLLTYTWGLYEQDVIKKLKPFTILSVAYKWLGGKTQVIACDKDSEKSLLLKLHRLLDEADIVIAHNGDSFDIKKINCRFIIHKLNPPSPYRTIDTKKEAKRIACFDSNSLNNLGIDMDEGEKVKHRGFEMWEGCMAGVKKDWNDMKRYNKKDVDLLERIYLRLRPWMKTHPDIRVHDITKDVKCLDGCASCESEKVVRGGFNVSKKGRYQRFQCLDCGAWSQGKRLEYQENRLAA